MCLIKWLEKLRRRRDASDDTDSRGSSESFVMTLNSDSSREDRTKKKKKGKHKFSRICPTELKSVGSAKLFWQSSPEYMFTLLILSITMEQ